MEAGEKIALRIEQTLMQDATGTMVMLARRSESRSAHRAVGQYVDHSLLQTDFYNADDHLLR